ncbi:MAG: nucleotidyl transferase AbiEii/AbiGii toxin family protein [Cellulomonadaceae bacterium]|jgi:hypothetical protein|nr:nucleotidyl transferase AbiEii/AbiGii toxin family protein [Cellulomonadaceae bacterium]
MAEPKIVSLSGFPAAGVEKVRRLAGVLNELDAEPMLAGRLALHGGTALNLFVLNLPRLSVDIDLNYIGAVHREAMLAERPGIEVAVSAIGRGLGYNVGRGPSSDSGGAFHLQYVGATGPDHVKIDVNYRNRSPLLTPEQTTVRLDDVTATFTIESAIEVIAGKLRALVGRVVIRDLFDVYLIAEHFPRLFAGADQTLIRRIVLYYLATSDPFPRPFEIRHRFAHRSGDIKADLVPMLASGTAPQLETMIDRVDAFVADLALPRDEVEAEFLSLAAMADLRPELLFAEFPATLTAALADPAGKWKMLNLAKAQR